MNEDLEKTHATTLKLGLPDTRVEDSGPALVQLAGPGAVRHFALRREITQIGRDNAANDIVLADRWVSRKHASIVLLTEGGARIEDRGSRHGCLVNSERVSEGVLADGDLIQIGQATFKFLDSRSAEAPFYQEVFRLAFRDPVTGTYSRRFFDEALAREMLRADRDAAPLSVLLIDVDQFKTVNDNLGHRAGDQVLAQTAKVLQDLLGEESITARFGGDEFAVLLPGSDVGAACACAERLRLAIESARMGAARHAITISVGVAASEPGAPWTAERLLAATDVALYRAKRAGRNRVESASLEDTSRTLGSPETEA